MEYSTNLQMVDDNYWYVGEWDEDIEEGQEHEVLEVAGEAILVRRQRPKYDRIIDDADHRAGRPEEHHDDGQNGVETRVEHALGLVLRHLQTELPVYSFLFIRLIST